MQSTLATPVEVPLGIDPAAAAEVGDSILLESVRAEKVERVPGSTRSSLQSAQARAWTMGGQVD